ncbi:MAG: MFS transporter [Ignavibacteriaceae bacterium]|nr:MFS transporter [Ignavibacteriaceae bacterium]
MKKNPALFMIFLVVFVDLLGFGILIPILPTFAINVLGVKEGAIGIAIAVYSLTQFFFNPLFGGFSDKYGRRKIILYCLLLNASGYIIFAFTHSYLLLIASRIIAGIGGSSIGVAQAYIADITTKENRAKGMGLIGVAFGLGFVFGPIMGGFLAHYSYMITGFTSACFSILAFSLSAFLLPESLKKEFIQTDIKRKMFNVEGFKKILNNIPVLLVIAMFFILTFSVANIYGTFALLGVKVYNFTNIQIGSIYGVIGFVSVIVQGGLIGRLSKKYSDNQLITVGSFLLALGLAFLPFGGSYSGLIIVIVILSLGTGTLQPILLGLISKVAPEKDQGIVLSVNQSISAFARVLGPLWGGFSFQYIGYKYPFLTGSACTLLILLFSVFYFKKHIIYEEPVKV